MDDRKISTQGHRQSYPLWKRLGKIFLWTIMGGVLAIYATVVCVVTLLSPDKLTPLVETVANKMLDADISIGRVELSAKTTYPFLRLQVDSLQIINPEITKLKADTALHLPEYADTLLTVSRFVGDVKLSSLTGGKIDIGNVDLAGPSLNIVIVSDSINNFDIVKTDDNDEDESTSDMPDIVVRRFAIHDAKAFRYFNAVTDISAGIGVETLVERDGERPVYKLTYEGSFDSKLLEDYRLTTLPLTLDGEIGWQPSEAHRLDLKNFVLGVSWLKIAFDLAVDFGEELIVERLDAQCHDIDLNRLFEFVPEKVMRDARLNELRTDAIFSLGVKLDSAFNVDRDSIPYATVSFDLPECRLTYGNARLERLSALVSIALRGNNPDDAVVDVDRLDLAGPATALSITGSLTNLMSDPVFDMNVQGHTDISKLPPPLMKHIEGYVSGRIKTSLATRGRASMFDRNRFHRLYAEGTVNASNLYWVAPDTNNMVFINDASVKFGTKMKFNNSRDLLAATVKVDSAEVLSGGVEVKVKELSLGVGVENNRPSADTTIVVPMGGGLKLSELNVFSITDSAGAKFREVAGRVVMRRFNNQSRVPEFVFDLGIDRLAAGSRDAKMLFSDSRLHFDAHKLPPRKGVIELRKTVDSISRVRPDLSPDSVIALAIEKRRSHHSKHHRVHAELTDSATEIIDWGTSKALGKLLLDWKLNGSLTSKRAGFFTPHFPLRNRLRNLDIVFNNDSILIKQIAYKVGRSDFLADGKISNLKGALTARRRLSPLKIELIATSDTVDVNQLADGVFRGAAYSDKRRDDRVDLSIVDDDVMFEKEMAGSEIRTTDSIGPVLIPANIEAEVKVKANNIMYADLLLHDMTGDLLMYDGAINLHQFNASSDVGSVGLTALYSAPKADNIHFGFGMNVDRFDISRFMNLVPALDSIMPLLRDIAGIINADIAATVDIGPTMDLELPTLAAAIKLQGDSLRLLDAESFRTIAKWLMFKDKQRNIIDHMNVEMMISDGEMRLFPFIFDIDRYKIGVQGYNDLALNFNYLISVLKSPIPFKFGITIKGNPEHYKIRLGRAKFNEKEAVERRQIVDTARVNLLDQIENVFRRGVRRSQFARLNLPTNSKAAVDINLDEEPVTAADSLVFIKEGLIPAPVQPDSLASPNQKKKK